MIKQSSQYTAIEFRSKLKQALDEVDAGKEVIIERYAEHIGLGKARPKKYYIVGKYENRQSRPKLQPLYKD